MMIQLLLIFLLVFLLLKHSLFQAVKTSEQEFAETFAKYFQNLKKRKSASNTVQFPADGVNPDDESSN